MKKTKPYGSFREFLGAVKRMIFAPENAVIYVLFLGAALFINAVMFGGLFTTPEQSWFGADGWCVLIFYGVTACALIAVIILSPIVYKKTLSAEKAAVTPEESEELVGSAAESSAEDCETCEHSAVCQPSVWLKMFSLWVPFALFLLIQTVYFSVMSFVSYDLELSVGQIFKIGGSLIALTTVWVMLCAFLYYTTETVGWYLAGVIALNVSWITIAYGIAFVYNSHSLVPESGVNTIKAVFSVALILCAVISVSLFIKGRLNKRKGSVRLSSIASVYKMTVIISIGLSCGFLFAVDEVSTKTMLIFLAVSLSAVLLFTYLAFRRNKLLLRMAVSLFIVVFFSLAVFLGIPAVAEREAYQLPKADEIESIRVFFGSMEYYELDSRFEECLELHELLLEKFEDGYMPDNSVHPYKKPECMAEVWDSTWKTVYFSYNLKNGGYVHREYKGLLDESFDEFYIAYFKSDLYEYTLKNTEYNGPKIEYLSGAYDGKGGSISEEQADALLETYCNELDGADESDFYVAYTEIRLSKFYGYYDRVLYVPVTFKETQKLIVEYIDKNTEN